MTARKTLKRQIRARMLKTGEAYAAARQHFRVAKESSMKTQAFNVPSAPVAHQLQPGLWPDWVGQHPWLKTFLPKAEAEARNQGYRECDHFCLILAFLRLPSPVSDWFVDLKVNSEQWREDVLVALGANMNIDASTFDRYIAYGKRIQKARANEDTVKELPLQQITHEAIQMLELAKSEADRDEVAIDERHFMVPMMDLHPWGEPTLEELRLLTGRS